MEGGVWCDGPHLRSELISLLPADLTLFFAEIYTKRKIFFQHGVRTEITVTTERVVRSVRHQTT
jgi:hypothetical protein